MSPFFRKIITLKNHKVSITLPDNFNANEEVEVIILPKDIDRVNENRAHYSTTKNPISNFSNKTEAFRQILLLKNHKMSITLPKDFHAEKIEAIVFPTEREKYNIPNWQIQQVRERTENYLKDPSIALDLEQVMKEIEDEFL